MSGSYRSDVDAILAARHDNGADFWATSDGRLAVGDPFSTLTSLMVLHELKVPRTHEAVRGALELVRRHVAGRRPVSPGAGRRDLPVRHGRGGQGAVPVRACSRPAEMQQTLAHFLETQHDDGGWRCNKFPCGRGPETRFSNPGVTLGVLDVFRFTEHVNTNPALDRAVDSLLDHWVVRRPIGPCHFGIGTLFLQVEFPFLRYNLFHYVYVLSFYDRARNDADRKVSGGG